MHITKEWLKEKGACSEGKQWFFAQKETKLSKVVQALIKDQQFIWASWTLTKVFTHKQSVLYACYSAKQSLHLFEKLYPQDDKPRKAVQAAMKWASNPTEVNRLAAELAAWSATRAAAGAAGSAAWSAESAAWSATWSAAWSAESAAWSATWSAARSAESAARSAAWSATRAAAGAAGSAAWSAELAAWSATWSATWSAESAAWLAESAAWKKILKYGLRLLK